MMKAGSRRLCFVRIYSRLTVLWMCCCGQVLLAPLAWSQDEPPAETTDTEYVRGVKAFAEGDFKKAADLWLADAYLGSADAQFNIGVLYAEGKGLPKDRGEAIFWFTKAAKQGNREAQYNLGHLLLEETEDIDKVRDGIAWWKKSAEAGFPVAQYNYGRALFYGIGIEEDRPGSRQWFARAANGGNEKAATFLSENVDNFVESAPAVEITEPPAIRSPSPNVNIASKPTVALINSSEYVLVKDKPILFYARFNNFSPIVTRVDAGMLLRVIKRARGWLLAELPGGLPGWIRNDGIEIEKGQVEVTAASVSVHADPTESGDVNDIGKLLKGSKVLLLEQQPGWTRVQLPEKIPGWIEEEGVRKVEAEAEEIAQVWQNQRVKQKLAALNSREVRVAAAPADAVGNGEETVPLAVDAVPDSAAGVRDSESTPAVDKSVAEELVIDSREIAAQTPVRPDPPTSADSSASVNPAASSTPLSSSATSSPTTVVTDTVAGSAADQESQSFELSDDELAALNPDQEIADAVQVDEAESGNKAGGGPDGDPMGSIRRTTDQDVRVRTAANEGSAVMIALPRYTLVDVLGRYSGFANVSVPGGIPVWVENRSLREREEEVVVEGNRVRARTQPNTDQEIVGLLPQGSILRVLDRRDGWLRVVAPEWITGWVAEGALEAPPRVAGLDRLWQEQSENLLALYLGERTREMAVVPREYDQALIGTGIRNDNRWLFQESSRKYTLQLFSMQNRQSAESLLGSLNRRGQFFSTVVKGDRWYYLLLGKFLTEEAAEAVAAKLPRWASGARVRSLARLQVNRCKKTDLFNEDEAKGLEELCR